MGNTSKEVKELRVFLQKLKDKKEEIQVHGACCSLNCCLPAHHKRLC